MVSKRDDLLHKPTSDDYTWTESNYFIVHLPERRMNGHVYALFKSNLMVVVSGA